MYLAVEDADAFRSKRIKSVMIDALVADVRTNHQLCLGQRLIVSGKFDFDFGDVAVGEERHPLVDIHPRSIVMHGELDLFRPAGHVDSRVTRFGVRSRSLEIPIRQRAIDSRVAGHDLKRAEELLGGYSSRRCRN